MRPLLKRTFSLEGAEIYQSMFPYQVTTEELRGFYDTLYVRERSLEWDRSVGSVFIQKEGGLAVCPLEPSLDWMPRKRYERNIIHKQVAVETLQWQLYVQDLWPPLSNIPEPMRKTAKGIAEASRRFNRVMLEKVKNEGIGGLEE